MAAPGLAGGAYRLTLLMKSFEILAGTAKQCSVLQPETDLESALLRELVVSRLLGTGLDTLLPALDARPKDTGAFVIGPEGALALIFGSRGRINASTW